MKDVDQKEIGMLIRAKKPGENQTRKKSSKGEKEKRYGRKSDECIGNFV